MPLPLALALPVVFAPLHYLTPVSPENVQN